MEERIKKLEEKVAKLEKESIKFPLDIVFMQALSQAMISFGFDKIRVRRVILTPSRLTTNPAEEGEVLYHGTTPSIKIYIAGAVKTFTIT